MKAGSIVFVRIRSYRLRTPNLARSRERTKCTRSNGWVYMRNLKPSLQPRVTVPSLPSLITPQRILCPIQQSFQCFAFIFFASSSFTILSNRTKFPIPSKNVLTTHFHHKLLNNGTLCFSNFVRAICTASDPCITTIPPNKYGCIRQQKVAKAGTLWSRESYNSDPGWKFERVEKATNVHVAATATTVIQPFGRLYFFTVISERCSAAVASASMATTRGRASDQDVKGGEMGIVKCAVGEVAMVMEEKVMDVRWALRAEKEDRWQKCSR